MPLIAASSDGHTQVWACKAEDIHFELMKGCPRCGTLFCSGDRDCDMGPKWHEDALLASREQGGHPDADFEEVGDMLTDPGVVTYVDPSELDGDFRTEEEDWLTWWEVDGGD